MARGTKLRWWSRFDWYIGDRIRDGLTLGAVLVGLAGCGGTASGVPESTAVEQSTTQAVPAPATAGFVYIAPGTFMMGSPSSEEGRYDNETQHSVTLTRGFYLQTTEVTQGEWQRVMGNNPSYFASCGSDCPVERVSWWDSVAYANALSRSEGLQECYVLSDCRGVAGSGTVTGDVAPLGGTGDYGCSSVSFVGLDCAGYRLPTEAEWEYAARAGTQTATYAGAMRILGGANAPVLSDIAWYSGNSGVSYVGGIDCSGWEDRAVTTAVMCGAHQVATQDPNAWGLYDMLGNLFEWTHDWDGEYGGTSTDPAGATSGSARVVRGGSFNVSVRRVRSANRVSNPDDYRGFFLGFRLARTAL